MCELCPHFTTNSLKTRLAHNMHKQLSQSSMHSSLLSYFVGSVRFCGAALFVVGERTSLRSEQRARCTDNVKKGKESLVWSDDVTWKLSVILESGHEDHHPSAACWVTEVGRGCRVKGEQDGGAGWGRGANVITSTLLGECMWRKAAVHKGAQYSLLWSDRREFQIPVW